MIQKEDLLSIGFYKKESFTGSFRGMRYKIAKQTTETDIFLVTIWPGPYGYDAAPDTLKYTKAFPFDASSLADIADYLNEQYQQKEWPTAIC